jgi:hypothetical protein
MPRRFAVALHVTPIIGVNVQAIRDLHVDNRIGSERANRAPNGSAAALRTLPQCKL